MTPPSLRLIVFPDDDRILREEVEASVARLPADLGQDDARDAVQRDLRTWYRSLVIHERSLLGSYPDDQSQVWYVYRDGRIRPRSGELDRLSEPRR